MRVVFVFDQDISDSKLSRKVMLSGYCRLLLITCRILSYWWLKSFKRLECSYWSLRISSLYFL